MHGLAGSALHQVVDDRHDDDPACTLVVGDTQLAVIRAFYRFRHRPHACRKNLHKRFIGVSFLKKNVDFFCRMSPSDRRIDGAEYASAHRHQMRCKLDHCVRSGHLRQQLLDFRCVAVMRYPVGFKAALHLSEEVRYVAGAARSGCAGFGIADDAVRHDPAFFH